MDDTQLNQNEPTLEDSIRHVASKLPAPVREYIGGTALPDVARSITAKYNLHIDQGAVFQRELMLVLMGIEEPGELAKTLQDELGLTTEVIGQILDDLNKEVFQPLQAKMRTATTEAPKVAPAVPVSLPGAGQWDSTNIGMPALQPSSPAVPATPPPPPQLKPIVKEYTSDPYHEPIDEK